MLVVAWAMLVSEKPSIAQESTGTNASQQLFIDQRRLPGDTEKANPSPPTENANQLHNADEQKKLDVLAAKLKAEEEELAAREAEARRKFEELKRLSEEADVKRKSDEDRLLAREAEAQKEVAEAKRLADEARAKLQAELQKQVAQKIESNVPPAGTTSKERNVSMPGQQPRSALNISAIALTCPDAVLSAQPLPGGRSKVSIQSPCRQGQNVSLQYGPIVKQRTLDDKGSAEFVADMFLGSDADTSVLFVDGKQQHLQLAAGDLDQVTKVAIVWNAPVNLDLHAFEYAASQGEPGDVWSGAPRDAIAAAALVTQDGRGHGFMSSTDDGKGIGQKSEVFTFLQSKQQNRGAIAMALDYETRGSEPGGDACGSGRYAEVAIEVVVREPGGAINKQDGIISSMPCGKRLSADARYQTGVVPDIRIHNTN
jgi:hypothetical protein